MFLSASASNGVLFPDNPRVIPTIPRTMTLGFPVIDFQIPLAPSISSFLLIASHVTTLNDYYVQAASVSCSNVIRFETLF